MSFGAQWQRESSSLDDTESSVMSEQQGVKRAKTEAQKDERAKLWRDQNVIVCGFSGKIGSGKTCAAETVQRAFGSSQCILRNFADRLKEEVAMHLGIDVALCYSHHGKNMFLDDYQMTLGEFLQKWGTMLRDLHPDIWVLAVQSFVDVCVAKKTDKDEQLLVLIGDVRFENECNWVQSVGGVVVRLNGDPGKERANSKRDHTHISETALDNYDGFDLVIDTEGCGKEETGNRILTCIGSRCSQR